jgi:glycosyltransferase involved in cell wall biosynthesis
MRQALGVDSQYFLCVSTHEERKNLQTLVQAYVDLIEGWHEERRPPDLILVGRTTPYTDVLRQLLSRSDDAARRTHFIQGISDSALAALYRGATSVLLASLCEGFGFPLVEAVACGTPALVSDLPVFHELVGDAATYVRAKDVAAWTAGMARAVVDPQLRVRSEQMASRVASGLSWRNSARQTLDVIEQVARQPGSRGRRGRYQRPD